MKELPQGWTLASIGDVTAGFDQHVPRLEEQFYYIDISSIDREFKKIVNPQWMAGDKAPSRARQVVKTGDVLVSMTRPNLNAVALVTREWDGQIASTGFDVLRPIEIESRWLFNLVKSPDFIATMSERVQGALYPAVRPRDIRGYVMPLAPFNEQKRIADKLDALLEQVDACRERLERVPQILKRFRQAVFTAATTGALTEKWAGTGSWTTSQLGTLLTDVRYGTAKKSTYDIKDGTPVLRIPNIINGRVDTNDLKYGHFEKKELETLSLKEGDLLIIRSNGSLDLVGKTAVVGSEVQGYLFAGYLIRLRVKSNLIDPRFLYFCLSSPDTRQHIELTARSTSGVNNINSEEIRSIEIKLPGVDEQLEIVRRVENLFAFADRLEARYIAGRERIDQLIPSLLDKAFSGELTAEWREQNPDLISGENSAEALLARIKTEKAEAVRTTITHRKSAKTKTGKNMKPKMIIPVAAALKAAGTPLTAQALLTQSGYPSNATTEDLERFFLDIRDQLKLGSILRKRSGDDDIFTLANQGLRDED